MSHRVYLNACSLPRMPEGSRNEWRDYWASPGAELEAKNAPPLLWWCLFGVADLRRARLLDDHDIDDPEGERARLIEEEGATEADGYPYLVTAQAEALARLGRRRAAMLAAIGERYAALYDGFAAMVGRDLGPFILLRTGGLADAGAAEGWLHGMAAAMDGLDAGIPPPAQGPFADALEDVRRWGHDNPAWLLSGAGAPGQWPTAEVEATYPRRRPAGGAGQSASSRPAAPRVGPVLEWAAAIVAGLGTVAVWVATGSWLWAALAFVAGTGVSVAAILRLAPRLNR